MMHTYIKHRDATHKHGALYTVGYWTPEGLKAAWHPLMDVRNEGWAMGIVSWLNGGVKPDYVVWP